MNPIKGLQKFAGYDSCWTISGKEPDALSYVPANFSNLYGSGKLIPERSMQCRKQLQTLTSKLQPTNHEKYTHFQNIWNLAKN